MATTLWPPLANTKVSSQGPAAAIIEQAVPNYTVKRRISAGDLSDDGVENVELTIIPIFDKLDKVPLMPPAPGTGREGQAGDGDGPTARTSPPCARTR